MNTCITVPLEHFRAARPKRLPCPTPIGPGAGKATRRRGIGFTLLEVIVVLAILSVTMTVSAALLCRVYESAGVRAKRVIHHEARLRMLTKFRADVKAYGLPEIVARGKDAPRELLRWKLQNGTIVYTLLHEGEFNASVVRRFTPTAGGIGTMERYAVSECDRIDVYSGTGAFDKCIALSLWQCPFATDSVGKDELDPFTGKVAESLEKRFDPKMALNWRTAIVRDSAAGRKGDKHE